MFVCECLCQHIEVCVCAVYASSCVEIYMFVLCVYVTFMCECVQELTT